MIRRRVLAVPAISMVTGRATALEFAGGAVTGVRVVAEGAERVEWADLVVDAIGRTTNSQAGTALRP
jgi:hypothetical protein